MKAILPKSWRFLPESEKKMIEQVKEEEINRRMMVILDIFIKMTCDVLNETEHMGESRLLCYIGNFHHVFNKHLELVREGKQMEYLDARMRKIFRKGGYPDQFFKSMFEDWDINTGTMDTADKNVVKTDFRTFLNEVRKYDSIIKNERKTIEYLTKNNLPDKDSLIGECESRICTMKQTKTDIMEAISKVSDPIAKAIYTGRYIRCETWKTISKSLSGMSERNAHLIHNKWLSELEENLEKVRKAA